MKLSELAPAELLKRLRQGTLLLELPPFVVRLRSNVAPLAEELALGYRDFSVLSEPCFADFHIEIAYESWLRRWIKPSVRFFFDGRPSFIPLSAYQAFPMLEWGLNWCVAAHSHQYLIIHAAVIERNDIAVILPAPPGSGKSTLCAALIHRGWRLLSDELALYDMKTGLVHGMARPVNLKNASIDVIRNFVPEAVITAPIPNTTKGTVALMQPPASAVHAVRKPAKPHWIVLPKYSPDSPPIMATHQKSRTFMLLAEQSFNYDIHGQDGFVAMGRLIDECDCRTFSYSKLEDAVAAFDQLAQERDA